jgi:hypothetical protein
MKYIILHVVMTSVIMINVMAPLNGSFIFDRITFDLTNLWSTFHSILKTLEEEVFYKLLSKKLSHKDATFKEFL